MDDNGAPTRPAPAAEDTPEVAGPAEPVRRGQHSVLTIGPMGPAGSGREALAALAATSGEDRAAGPGPHPEAEAVLLVPATVVRLERPLAHWEDSATYLEMADRRLCRRRETRAAQNGRLNTDRSTVRGGQRTGQTGPAIHCRSPAK